MFRNVSTKTGKVVSSGTIQSYVSLLKGYMLFTYDFELPADSPRLSRVIKMIRCNDPLAGMRGKRRGFRRRHLRLLWELGGARCSSSKVATTLLAALGTSWHTLARGGELCLPTRGDLKFKVLSDGATWRRNVAPTKPHPWQLLHHKRATLPHALPKGGPPSPRPGILPGPRRDSSQIPRTSPTRDHGRRHPRLQLHRPRRLFHGVGKPLLQVSLQEL